MRKGPAAGSREWEQLFRKLMEDEYLREGLDTWRMNLERRTQNLEFRKETLSYFFILRSAF
jgi:hypothetical protein